MKKQGLIFIFALTWALACVTPGAAEDLKVIKITAKRFEYNPNQIVLKKGVSVLLQLTSEDRMHGFSIPGMNLRTNIPSGKTTEIKLTPEKSGEYAFFCDVFCGSGHEDMNGKITVTN